MQTLLFNNEGQPDPYEAYRTEYRRLIQNIHSVLTRAGRFGGRK